MRLEEILLNALKLKPLWAQYKIHPNPYSVSAFEVRECVTQGAIMTRLPKRYSHFFFRNSILIQGIYYLIFGIWPLLSIRTFQAITGPKTDLWLVHTVGLLLMINGFILTLAAYGDKIDWSIYTIGICTALSLLGIEVVYVFNGTISAVYLLDAGVEILFIFAWIGMRT
jgi:uncharacterized membrane protein